MPRSNRIAFMSSVCIVTTTILCSRTSHCLVWHLQMVEICWHCADCTPPQRCQLLFMRQMQTNNIHSLGHILSLHGREGMKRGDDRLDDQPFMLAAVLVSHATVLPFCSIYPSDECHKL